MNPYRSAGGAVSPSGDRHIESERMLFDSDDDEEENALATGSTGGGNGDAEQSEALLSKEIPEPEVEGEKPIRFRPRKNPSWFIRITPILVVIVMVLYNLSLIIRSEGDLKDAGPGLEEYLKEPIKRRDGDYVLDPNWDFGAPSQRRSYKWVIMEKEGNPDGIYKPMLTINGQFPGPLIEINEGDTIVVDVQNLATNATAIHWHGLFQNGSAWMDGTPGVTQCPIPPGRSFQYEFTVKGQAGTYFYHGHQGVQTLDGLVGPLVIHGRDEAKTRIFPYVTDRVVLLNDWYYDSASALMRQVLSPGNEDSPIPNAALINGLNQVDCSLHPTRDCYTENTYLPTMNLAAEANHRIRFVNAGGYAWFQVSIDEHMSLPIIEIDGTPVEPAPESNIVLAPGQRYSIILTTDIGGVLGVDAFWLRARMIKACFAKPKIPENGVDEAKAIIRYTPSPVAAAATAAAEHPPDEATNSTQSLPVTNNTNTNNPMICKDMTARRSYRPSPQLPAPESADQSWYVRTNLVIGNWRLQRGVMNSSSLRPNLEAPTLQRLLDGLSAGNASFAAPGVNRQAFDTKHELVVSHARLETVDVVVQNMDENSHPFHLHGNKFWVLAAGHGYFPGYAALNLRPGGRGLLDPANRTIVENPLRRDVATAEGFGWMLLRFVADNPGVWLFHCHMIWHSEAGMGMQFVSRLDDMRDWKIPAKVRHLCDAPAEELAKGAPPPDEVFYGFHDQR